MHGGPGRMSSITQSGNQRLVLDFKSVMRKESTMPFNNDRPWSFDRQAIESFQAGQTGVYAIRSEEHTSELQSQSNLVCRLLLEKKKTALHCVISQLITIIDYFII